MCSAHDWSTPTGTFRKRSKSSHTCRCRVGSPRRRSSSATKCTVRSSRRLPRWTRPEGLMPDDTVTTEAPSPACRTASSAARVTQSCGSPPARAPFGTVGNATGGREPSEQPVSHAEQLLDRRRADPEEPLVQLAGEPTAEASVGDGVVVEDEEVAGGEAYVDRLRLDVQP